MMPTISTARILRHLRPGVGFVLCGDVITQWDSSDLPPSTAEMAAGRLTLLRAAAHDARHTARTKAETGGFVFNGHLIDSDRDSILRIGNAATTALTAQLTGAPFSTTWTCADEYQMPLDAAGVMALQAALSAHGLDCHLRSQELKTMIDDPNADLDYIASIINTGWPNQTS